MPSNECIIRVDIVTGRVLEDNLAEFWAREANNNLPDPVWHRNPAMHGYAGLQPRDELLAERVRRFNSTRRRRTKNAWTDTEVYRLAVLMGRQRKKPHQAAAWLPRSPRACQMMFKEMQNAGVI